MIIISLNKEIIFQNQKKRKLLTLNKNKLFRDFSFEEYQPGIIFEKAFDDNIVAE